MAWLWNKEKKQKQEIQHIKKLNDFPTYEVTFKEKCVHCGRKEVREYNLRMNKDPLVQKAIGNYINEQYDYTLDESIKMAKKVGKAKASKLSYMILNKRTLNMDFVDFKTLAELAKNRKK